MGEDGNPPNHADAKGLPYVTRPCVKTVHTKALSARHKSLKRLSFKDEFFHGLKGGESAYRQMLAMAKAEKGIEWDAHAGMNNWFAAIGLDVRQASTHRTQQLIGQMEVRVR